MDGTLDFQNFFYRNMMKKDTAFIVDKKFIVSWEAYI